MSSKYQSWTLKLLKAELKLRGIKSSGKKKDLVERLQSLDIMQVTSKEQPQEVEYNMPLPDPSSYIDIHAGSRLPDLPMSRILQYLKNQDKELEDKIQQLYEQRYLRFLRVAQTSGDAHLYITGNVWAEMRKSVAYKVDVALDINRVILEAQCECAAGQGPSAHCKHVACILYGIHRFTTKGDLITEKTCTQKLQTFHHTKPYKGSPMKATDLQEIRQQKFEYDPRPLPERNQPGYADHFRNTVLNFQGDKKMPVLQLFKPADPHAINLMHDYHMSSEEAFMTREMLHAITEEEIIETEVQTREQAQKGPWMDKRTKRVTASKFGTISKATSCRDLDLLAEQLISPKPIRSRAISHGHAYESVAVERFEKEYEVTEKCGLFIHEEYPWLAASPDRVIDSDRIIEIKCPFTAKDKKINHVTVPYLKNGPNGLILDRKHDHFYQVQGQMLCAQKKMCYFCVYTLKDFEVVEILRDEKFMSDMVVKLKSFYENHFEPALFQKHVYRFYDRYF